MNRLIAHAFIHGLPAALLLVWATAQADQIALSTSQAEALGINIGQPVAVDAVGADTVPARITLPPANNHLLTSAMAGLITDLYVPTGATVSRGQALIVISSPEVVRLKRDFLAASSAARLARSEYDRDRDLNTAGVIAKRRLQTARARMEETTAQLSAQGGLLELAGVAPEEIQRLQVDKAFSPQLTLLAPIDGVVMEQFVRVGERVDAHAPLYRIADLSTLWVEARVPQERIPAVQASAKLLVTAHQHVARITQIGQVVDPLDQTVMVRAVLSQVPADVRPGQFVTAALSSTAAEAFLLPSAAVISHQSQFYVFVRNADGFEARPVRLGSRDRDRITITEGLYGSEEVAISGTAALKAAWAASDEAS